MGENYEIILSRLKEVLSARSDADVARGLEISTAALSAFKKQGKFPYERLVKFCLTRDISIDWLFKGEQTAPPAPTALNKDLLRSIIEGIEEYLDTESLELPADKKAELAVYLYERLLKEKTAASNVRGEVKALLKLVA